MQPETFEVNPDVANLKVGQANLTDRVDELEKKLDVQEREFAQLFLAYMEVVVMVEALMSELIFGDDTKTQAFHARMQTTREKFLKTLNEHANAGKDT